jgi:hypothetical protein
VHRNVVDAINMNYVCHSKYSSHQIKNSEEGWAWWGIPIIPDTWEMKRIMAQGQPGQKVIERDPTSTKKSGMVIQVCNVCQQHI